MVHQFLHPAIARQVRSAGVVAAQSIPRPPATLCASRGLRVSLHRFRRAPQDRRLVATGTQRNLLARPLVGGATMKTDTAKPYRRLIELDQLEELKGRRQSGLESVGESQAVVFSS